MRATATQPFSGNQAYWPLSQSSSSSQSTQLRLKVRLHHLFHMLVAQLTNSAEPRVWQSQDATGHPLWNAYDAATDRIIRNASETEVRAWLEARYQVN